jgi:outer membrane protein insertion porin family
MIKLFLKVSLLIFLFISFSKAEKVEKIDIKGNLRVNSETIIMFSEVSIGEDLSKDDLNNILKKLYQTNFFKDVKLEINQSILKINVIENPIIQSVKIQGVKNKSLENALLDKISLNKGISFEDSKVAQESNKIQIILRKAGFYLSSIETLVAENNNNTIDLVFKIDLGEKAYIGEIAFIGDKKFKSRKLRNIIVSEEDKFWKFLSQKKFINKERIELDKRLLINYYKNKGYFNAKIQSDTILFDKNNNFKLVFKIDSGKKYFFNKLSINYPDNYDELYFKKIEDKLNKFSNQIYSFKAIEKILKEIEIVAKNEDYEFVDASIDQNIFKDNQINIDIEIVESDKFYIKKINVLGNNVTIEDVIRNQLFVDEGDPLNNVLFNKSVSAIKSLNIFKSVKTKIRDTSSASQKEIDIIVEEKPTGEISLGAGVGSSGASTFFGVKENNFLGRGIKLDTNLSLSEETLKGQLFIVNQNYDNSDRDLIFRLQASETDRLTDFGYKTNNTGVSIGTNFEYLDDLFISPSISLNNESIETSNDASDLLKKQEGSYLDIKGIYSLTYDKTNQKYEPSDGFLSTFSQSLPLSFNESQTVVNGYEITNYHQYLENKVLKMSFYGKAANSLGDDDVRISERLYVPTKRLRGFERGKVGPLDNGDFVGGNYVTTLNISAELPVLDSLDTISLSTFYDAANVWGVDYNSALDESSKIRSSVGVAANWYTPIGPLNFSFAHPITKVTTDKTEGFRFNLGTTF